MAGPNVAAGQKQESQAPRWLAAQVPAGLEQFSCDLESDEGLAGTGCERKKNAVAALGDGLDARQVPALRLFGAAQLDQRWGLSMMKV